MRTNLIRGIGREVVCQPINLPCVKGPDVSIDNHTDEYITVIVKGEKLRVRDWCRLEIYDIQK